MKKILFALLCVLCAGSSYATRYKISDIYELAKANNTEELAKVSNINGHDMYKDTAICHAIKDGNVEAYKLLLAHGAKADHACTKKIPEQDYTKFMDKVAASSATKTTGFWGLSKWLWGALGLGVVGTGAVIAASGSGGGDSGTADNTNKCDGYIASCDTGYKVVDTCQSGNITMVKCEFDDENYVKQNGTVYEKLNCVNGIQNGNACTCSMGYINDLCDTFDDVNFINISGTVYHRLNCQNGGTQVGNTCNCVEGWTGTLCDQFDNTNFFLDPTDSQIYQKLNCQNGGTQNANMCNCVTGWTGTLCDTPASCTGYDHTSNATCPEGYTTGSSCLSGTTTKYMCDTLIPLNCSNGHQEGTVCSCDDGWEGTLCDTAHSCSPANEGSSMYAGGCPEGYQLTNVEICQSGNTSYYECALIPLNCSNGHQEGTVCSCDDGWTGTLCDQFDDTNFFLDPTDNQVYNKLNCVHGNQNQNSCVCDTGYIGTLCNAFDYTNYFMDPADNQIYNKLNCVHGTQSGNTCNCVTGWEGTLCDTAASCTGYDHTSNATCPEGYTTGSSCLSGTTTKYMCDTLIPLNCSNGHQEGTVCACDTGWTGTLCDTAHNCDAEFTQTSCGTGYLETGTCKSGNTTYVSCTLDTEHYIEQNGQIYPKLNCQNGGTQNANTCNCVTGWTGTLCDTAATCPANYKPACTGGYEPAGTEPCQSGDSTLVGCQEIQCGANATWSESGCNCEQGHENWQSGTGCSLIPLTCGNNAHQEGIQCVCENGYQNWTDGVGCSLTPLTCGNNAHQDGTQCVCESGYQNWQSNTGCSLIPINCNHGTQNGTACSCNTGYVGDFCNTLDSEHYIEQYGQVYEKLNCVHGTQTGAVCECNSAGWEGVLCDTPHTCTVEFVATCSAGEVETGSTCPSGDNILVECELAQCGVNATWSGSECACDQGYQNWQSGVGCEPIPINCNHGTQNGITCSCNEGWTGAVCDTAAVCDEEGYQLEPCSYAEIEISYCQSGDTRWVECMFNDVSYIQQNGHIYSRLNCDHGHQDANTCVCDTGYTGELCGTFDDEHYFMEPDGSIYQILNCVNGAQLTDHCSCNEGWTGTLCDTKYVLQTENADGGWVIGFENSATAPLKLENWGSYSINGVWGEWGSGANNTFRITMINKGTGSIYGVYQMSNSDIGGGAYNGYNGSVYFPEAVIEGVNYSSGSVYGLGGYGLFNAAIIDLQNLSDGNAYGVRGESARNSGNININNIGTGSAYGMYGYVGNSASIANSGTINITRESYTDADSVVYNPTGTAGAVYGIYGTNLNSTAYKYTTTTNTTGTINITSNSEITGIYNDWSTAINNGTINITQNGNANAYGIFGGTSTNATSGGTGLISIINNGTGAAIGMSDKSTNANGGTGTIEIINKGNGFAIGMDSGYEGHNAVVNNGVPGIGVINIVNYSSCSSWVGSAAGMNGLNLYNENEDTEYGQSTSEINIQNLSNGFVAGMYGQPASPYTGGDEPGGILTNSGTININNIGTGSVGGIFGGMTVTNSGTINITRESYTDTYGDEHNPSGNSGVVYGISGATVTNHYGTINITSNGGITGIEGNAVNNGTVNITQNGSNIVTAGIWGDDAGSVFNAKDGGYGQINIVNNGTGAAYGLLTSNYSGNAKIYNVFGNGSGQITILNKNSGDAYGIYSGWKGDDTEGRGFAYNAHTDNGELAIGNIDIVNYSSGVAVGMFGLNIYNETYDQTTSEINIENLSNGNAYGMWVFKSCNLGSGVANNSGTITINNIGTGSVRGMYGYDDSTINNSGTINITRNSYTDTQDNTIIHSPTGIAGNIYGIYNHYGIGTTNSGDINITTNGNAYGIFTTGSMFANLTHSGTVNMTNLGSGSVYGISSGVANGQTTSEINMQNLSNGNAYGMYVTEVYDDTDNLTGGMATNSGTITINNIGTGSAYGIFGDEESTITNSGTINITRNSYTDPLDNTIVYNPSVETAGNVFGIYAKSGSTVNNSGTINVTTNGNAYGIYVESGSTVTNTGTITLNGVSCDGTTCDGSNSYGNHIVLNGSTLYNSGVVQANTLNLNSMGGKVVAGLGSQFVVDNELSGDLNISSDVVMDGNQTTYVANNMIDAGDISKLNVRSASAMFDATIADNKHDIVMQMKDFNELTDNASLAQFLADNYAKGNGNDLFAALKSLENMSAFNGALAGLTGLDTFTQFAHEDLSAMREISFSMNNKLFENSSRDSFDISDSTGYFSFSNSRNGGSGQYGISSNKITDNLKLGYGMAMANINTGDDNGMHRQNKMWLFYMPATYTNDGYELVVAPKAGFARSEYNRRGYNNMNYDGYIEKRIFGLMNDLRYPLNFGNWTIAPDLAFNAIVYDQSGHEDEQEFSLIIPDDRTVSVETGLGLYTKYEKTLQDGGRFKLNSGLMVYREFGDTYDIKLGMRGMDGTFSLYNNDYEYRGAANIGFDYMAGRLHVYGNAQYFMDNNNYMNFKSGVSYRF